MKITLGSFQKFFQFSRRGKFMPWVSTIPMANCATGTAGVVDTGGKFATGVNYTRDESATPVANCHWYQ